MHKRLIRWSLIPDGVPITIKQTDATLCQVSVSFINVELSHCNKMNTDNDMNTMILNSKSHIYIYIYISMSQWDNTTMGTTRVLMVKSDMKWC